MVITCPHALGLAVPLVIAVSTAIAANSGLLIREREAFERARDLQAIVFDKTGTLTMGVFGVTDVFARGTVSEEEIIRRAASVEANSEHPIARGIVQSAEERGIELLPLEDFRAITGKGVEARIAGTPSRVVSPGYLSEAGIPVDDERVATAESQGKTVVFLLEDQKLLGALPLADIILDESRDAIARLKEMGLRCMMLTGDNRYVAGWVAGELGLDDYFAEVLPHEKSKKIEEIQQQYRVAMVTAGINDAPALVQADVGTRSVPGRTSPWRAQISFSSGATHGTWSTSSFSKGRYTTRCYRTCSGPQATTRLQSRSRRGVSLLRYRADTAVGAVLMSLSTIIVAINARLLRLN